MNPPQFELCLFVAGDDFVSMNAISNLERMARDLLKTRAEIRVIDVLDDPKAARQHQVIVTPMLMRHRPSPPRKVIGDLSDARRVLTSLGIPTEPSMFYDEPSA